MDKSVIIDSAFAGYINSRAKYLDELAERLSGEIDGAPAGTLRIIDKKSYIQYYWRKDASDTNGEYIAKKDIAIAKALAQKEYNKKILRLARKELKILSEYNKVLRNSSYEEIYKGLHRARKQIVEPVIDDIDDYVSNWKNDFYEPMGFKDNTEYYTQGGVRVRSKSELIIANLLEQYDIPYKYEKPVWINGIGQVRPDFVCLNKKLRKEYIWEHFGMMDNVAYANKNIGKINAYQQDGYVVGKNMIVSFESSLQPISSKNIRSLVEQYLIS